MVRTRATIASVTSWTIPALLSFLSCTFSPPASNQWLHDQKHHGSDHEADHQLHDRAEHTAHIFASFVVLLSPYIAGFRDDVYRPASSSLKSDMPASTVTSAMRKTSMIWVALPKVS